MGKKAFQMLLEPGSDICIGIDTAIQEHLSFGHDIEKARLGSEKIQINQVVLGRLQDIYM